MDFSLSKFFAHPQLLSVPGRLFVPERGQLVLGMARTFITLAVSWRGRLDFSTLTCQSLRILLLLRAAGFSFFLSFFFSDLHDVSFCLTTLRFRNCH